MMITETTEHPQHGTPTQARERKRRARRTVRLPRTLLLWWSLWLLVSWLLSFGWDSPIRPNLRAYESSVGHLLVLLAIGIGVVWPLFRLSALNRGGPRVIAFIDFTAMAFTLQVVLWPMRLSGRWYLTRLIALDWTLCAWSLIIAACIAIGSVSPLRADHPSILNKPFIRINSRRALWMFIILLLSSLGPLLSLMMNPDSPIAAEVFQWSPVTASWWKSKHTLETTNSTEWFRLFMISLVGIIAWVGLFFHAKAKTTGIPPSRRIGDVH